MAIPPDPTQESAPPAVDWESDDNPYRARFNDYRTEADKRQTRLSQYEQDITALRDGDTDAQRAAAQRLGIELEFEETDPDPYGSTDEYDRKFAAFEAKLAAMETERQQEQYTAVVTAQLNAMGLDDTDADWVLARATALPPSDDGLPDLARAHTELKARDEAAMQRWAQTKKASRSVRPGVPGTEAPNVLEMSDAERVEYMMDLYEQRSQ